MTSISHHGANTTLVYTDSKSINSAALRCSTLTIDYAVNSEESHARQTRAFYPHRRSQGNFAMTFDFKGYREYTATMTWFQNYAKANLLTGVTQPYPIWVTMPSRGFFRLGIPTTGIEFGDHTGSMVFSPVITFISVSDPADTSTSILRSQNQGKLAAEDSVTSEVKGSMSSLYFYPDSLVNTPGKLDAYLYGQSVAALAAAANAAALAAEIQSGHQTALGAHSRAE